MKVINTERCNMVLKGNGANIFDLPVTVIQFADNQIGVESCWELSDEDIEKLKETRRVYLTVLTTEHPPVLLSTEPTEIVEKTILRIDTTQNNE